MKILPFYILLFISMICFVSPAQSQNTYANGQLKEEGKLDGSERVGAWVFYYENGHVESFHNILGTSLKREKFTSLKELEERLEKFYTSYNNDRSHSGTKGVPPSKFWALFELGTF